MFYAKQESDTYSCRRLAASIGLHMDPASTSGGPQVRHEIYYFDDDPMAIFLVEQKLFKVHRHPFIRGSQFFRDMFAQAGGKGQREAEGMTEEQPLPLPDVTVKEFEVLLRFFYATIMRSTPNEKSLIQILGYDQEEKLALLSIAHRFVFDKIFQYILKEIKPDDIRVVERICLGDKYDLNEWLLSAYKNILDHTPEGKPTREEAEVLGLERVNKLLQAKNCILYEQTKSYAEDCKRYQRYAESYKAHVGHQKCRWCPRWPNTYSLQHEPVEEYSMESDSELFTTGEREENQRNNFPVAEIRIPSTEKIVKKYFFDDPNEQESQN